ncbi:MAG: PAS domain S-box protein, partial [Acidimicrobiales bacterium]
RELSVNGVNGGPGANATERLGARRRLGVVILEVAVVLVLLVGSLSLTAHQRHQAQVASRRVVAVTSAAATLSTLESDEYTFFTGAVTMTSAQFSIELLRVLRSVNSIHDPAATGLLKRYVGASLMVARLVYRHDLVGAATAERNVQAPAGNALIAEYSRYASAQSATAESTITRTGQLSETVDLGALALLAASLGLFWYLDARADRERRREVERAEARFRGIVARGSDAVWLIDPAGAVLFASESTRSVLGVDVDADRRPAFVDLFPEDERAQLTRALAEVFEDPDHSSSVAVSIAEPEKRYLEVVLTNKCDDGSIGAVVVSIRDLTERRKAETALERSEALMQDLLDHTPVSIYVKNLDGRYERVNKAWAQTVGRTPAEAVGATAAELFSPANGETINAADRVALERGPYEAEMTLEIDGRRRTFLASRFPLRDAAGVAYAVGGVAIDISDRTRAEDLERTLGAMVTTSGDAIFTTSGGEIVFWNDAATALLGYVSGDVIGAAPSMLTPAGFAEEHAELWSAVSGGVTVQAVETRYRRKDGELVDVEVTLTPQRGADGLVTGVSAIVRDATERRRRHEELSRQARTDGLTGLPNRSALTGHLARVVSRSAFDGSTAALLFFDLDHFKAVNDGFGHAAGDEVLRATATRVRAVLRPADFVARLGGDEFVAVCYPVGGRAEGEEIARRVGAAVATPVTYGEASLTTSASVGVALTPVHDALRWLAQGDAAMYQAKRDGRNRVVVYVEGMVMDAPDRSDYPQDPPEVVEEPHGM